MRYLSFIPIILILTSCFSSTNINNESDFQEIDYREKMRSFVISISESAKFDNPDFIIIPQNGIELVAKDKKLNPHIEYLNAIDGNGQEDLFYGYEQENRASSDKDSNYLKKYLNISKEFTNTILVTDYCSTESNIKHSYLENKNINYISFAAPERDLNTIPDHPVNNENPNDINSLDEISNFLYLINFENYLSKIELINNISNTNYDLIIIDLFFNDGSEFSISEINRLKTKANGGKRLVICYMSIGEAENYRYYWNSKWLLNKPVWLDSENPNWKGNYKVKYWNNEWQNIIFGNKNSYLSKIKNAEFDGVYLDIIDAFVYYE